LIKLELSSSIGEDAEPGEKLKKNHSLGRWLILPFAKGRFTGL